MHIYYPTQSGCREKKYLSKICLQNVKIDNHNRFVELNVYWGKTQQLY